MKTRYIKPEIETMVIETSECLMNGSPVKGGSVSNPGAGKSPVDDFSWDDPWGN